MLNPTVFGETPLNEFTTGEIETVLAHELGHRVNKDIRPVHQEL